MTNNNEMAVVVRDLDKTFRLPHEQHSGLKQFLINFTKREADKGYETQRVLEDITFEVKKGEFFGVVGRNGSGKSTLLKLLAGIYAPNSGLVQVNGSLTPFIELGVGFNPELTGRENVFLNGALLGFSRQEMEDMYEDIVEFAELAKFMDQKLKNYSSGMQVRLAFSIAIRAKSDILLIDEVLAVGDAAFQAKCFDYFYRLKQSDTTVIFISHDRASLERFCTRGILIDEGKIIKAGPMKEVLDAYGEVVLGQMATQTPELPPEETKENTAKKQAHLQSIKLLHNGEIIKNADFDDKLSLEISIEFLIKTKNPIIGATIWKHGVDGNAIYATNNIIENTGELGVLVPHDVVRYSVELPGYMNDGEYTVEVGISDESGVRYLLQDREALKYRIFGSHNPHSIMGTAANMHVEKIEHKE